MQFTQENCDKVMSGRKTMTTRRNLPRGCAPGKTIAIQPGRGKYAVGRSMVERVEEMEFWKLAQKCYEHNVMVGEQKMPLRAAWYYREGFDSPQEFLECLLSLAGNKAEAGKVVTNNEKVWVIMFSKPVSIEDVQQMKLKGWGK